MFRRTNTIIRELTRSLQAACQCAQHKNNVISSEVAPISNFALWIKWTWFFFLKGGFIALIHINHTCKLQNCSLTSQFTTVSLQLHVGESD
jgi:hypothetical protein